MKPYKSQGPGAGTTPDGNASKFQAAAVAGCLLLRRVDLLLIRPSLRVPVYRIVRELMGPCLDLMLPRYSRPRCVRYVIALARVRRHEASLRRWIL